MANNGHAPEFVRQNRAEVADNEALNVVLRWLMPVLAFASLVLGYWFIVTSVPRGERMRTVVPTLVGAVLGGMVWDMWLGPWCFPESSSASRPRLIPVNLDPVLVHPRLGQVVRRLTPHPEVGV